MKRRWPATPRRTSAGSWRRERPSGPPSRGGCPPSALSHIGAVRDHPGRRRYAQPLPRARRRWSSRSGPRSWSRSPRGLAAIWGVRWPALWWCGTSPLSEDTSYLICIDGLTDPMPVGVLNEVLNKREDGRALFERRKAAAEAGGPRQHPLPPARSDRGYDPWRDRGERGHQRRDQQATVNAAPNGGQGAR